MSLSELRLHLVEECPNMQVECLRCYAVKKRQLFEIHSDLTCIKNLQTKLKVFKQENENLKRRRIQ